MRDALFLADPDATTRLAQAFAPVLRAGDVLLLDGDIGAGKSHFARSLIQTILGRAEDVPSPTFTLVQTYDGPVCEIWHSDLYRLSAVEEVEELGLLDAFDTAICLVEWPDRLQEEAPDTALRLTLTTPENGEGRNVTFDHSTRRWDAVLRGLDV